MLELGIERELSKLGPAVFARFPASQKFPFLSFEWLSALENCGVVGGQTGWTPTYFVVRDGAEVKAFAPFYLKTNSMGEFVFDHAFAEFSEMRLGLPYYPKLVVAVPFTPATGPRMLFSAALTEEEREECEDLIISGARLFRQRVKASSTHVLFCDEREALRWTKSDYALRLGVQFQFHRAEARSFEDYLARFNAKRRAAIRRERRTLAHVPIEIVSGDTLSRAAKEEGFSRSLYELYLTTVDKYAWGRRYLNEAFFSEVLRTMPERIHVVLAREPDSGEPLACAFNLLGKEALYGRYWGTFRDEPFLHFEVCLYRGVEECIRLGLDRFEPGAGGEHKESRGFVPTVTRSVHEFASPVLAEAVEDFFLREADALTKNFGW